MVKRKHRNKVSRLTAKERARNYLRYWGVPDGGGADQERDLIAVLGAHARATLDRAKRRRA